MPFQDGGWVGGWVDQNGSDASGQCTPAVLVHPDLTRLRHPSVVGASEYLGNYLDKLTLVR